MKADAEAVTEIVSNMWVAEWAKKAGDLPSISPFTVTMNSQTVTVDESVYYQRYGSLSATRDYWIWRSRLALNPKKAYGFDFGYGSIGHIRMFACCGLRATGVDVAPLLKPMYANASETFLPRIRFSVLDGRFPKEQELVERIGGDYALVISKNVLKKGYIHPAREADPRKLINLGVSDEDFLSHIHRMLRRKDCSLFTTSALRKQNRTNSTFRGPMASLRLHARTFRTQDFEGLHFDVVDHAEARRHGHALGWDTPRGGNMSLGD